MIVSVGVRVCLSVGGGGESSSQLLGFPAAWVSSLLL